MAENNSLDIQGTTSTHVFPELSQGTSKTVALSIIDSTVLNLARCAGIWYFDPPSSPETALSVSHLREPLSTTLNSYPQLSGRVSFVTPRPNSGHTNRYLWVQVTYNASTDVGVSFTIRHISKNCLRPHPKHRIPKIISQSMRRLSAFIRRTLPSNPAGSLERHGASSLAKCYH